MSLKSGGGHDPDPRTVYEWAAAPVQYVYVIFGVYSDKSAAKLLGIYSLQRAAEDRVNMLKSADTLYQVNYVKMPIDQACAVRLEP